MNLIQLGIPIQRQSAPDHADQTVGQAGSVARPSHPNALSLALMSFNALHALDQIEGQPNGHHQLLALLVRNGIADNALHMQSNQGADACYGQDVNVPGGEVAKLTVQARLNDQAQYDILGIDLHLPASGKTESIHLSPAPAVDTHGNASAILNTGQRLPPTQLAAYYSRSQLTEAMVRQNILQDSKAAPLPSGSSNSVQSTVFSHTSSTAGETTASSAPSRTTTYPASSHSAATASRDPLSMQRPANDHLRTPNYSLRTLVGSQVRVATSDFGPNPNPMWAEGGSINRISRVSAPLTAPIDESSVAPISSFSAPSNTGVPTTGDQTLYALSTDGALGEIHFLKRPPEQVADLCRLGIKLIGKSFPLDLNKIDFTFYKRGDNPNRGFTTLEGNRAEISIGLIPDIDWNDDIEMHGMILFTVFHEAFLHALPDLRTASSGAERTTEQQDHDVILIPADNKNLLHRAVKQALPEVPEHLQQYFLDAYVSDVEGEIFRNDHIDEQASERWYDLLDSNLANINSPFWRS